MFMLVPVLGYEHLRQQAKKYLAESNDFKSVILIDCGSVVDVSSYFKLGGVDGVCAFVIDYHRPVHRANIHNRDNVVVFADTPTVPDPRGPAPQPEPLQDDDLEGDARSGGEDQDSPQKRARTTHPGDGQPVEPLVDGDNDYGDNDNNNNDDEEEDNAFAADYASGSFYGTSSAVLMHELAAQLSAETSQVLWLAIVGLTEHYLMHRCSHKQYNKQLESFRLATVTSNDHTLQFERHEFQFVLYRHWSLYDSMFHSPQVAARLGIWSEGGRRKLDQLLAKMGFPLEQCKERYSVMSQEMKNLLPVQLSEHAPEFGLEDVTYASFVRQLDTKTSLSAADCVYAVSALIEVGVPRSTGALDIEFDDESWKTFVLGAYDALSAVHSEDQAVRMDGGLKRAIELQNALVREGVDLLLKKVIVRNGPFRYGLLQDAGSRFCHWQALTRLALFVLEALKKPNKTSKPLVLCALNRTKDAYLVLGVTPAAPSTRAKRNDFGISFHQAARMTGTRVQFHSFDSSVIEVGASDIARFLELLHSGLIAE